jgi:hypothetical protein
MSTPPATNTKTEAALLVLADASKAKRDWSDIAQALLTLEATSPLDEKGRPWIKRAEEISGITVNQLRRMTRTLRFVTELETSEPKLAEQLQWRKFSSIEVIGKIFAADRGAAVKIIRENPPGATFRALLEKLDDVKRSGATVTPQSAGKMAARDFVKQCQMFLDGAGKQVLTGSGHSFHLVRPTLPLHFANPDFLLFQTQGSTIVNIDAIDCYALAGDVDQPALERRAVQVATEATFFERFLILVPPGKAAWFFPDTFEWLGLTNVSVIDITILTNERPPAWPRAEIVHSTPKQGGLRRQAWIKKNDYQLRRILSAAGLNLSLPS